MGIEGFADMFTIQELQVYGKIQLIISVSSISIVVILALWRVWRFNLSPILYSTDPKELPYWIPGKSKLRMIRTMLGGSGN